VDIAIHTRATWLNTTMVFGMCCRAKRQSLKNQLIRLPQLLQLQLA
jgi:hypothetical protein